MKSLVCPVSPLRINSIVVRIVGFSMATLIALYVATGNIYFVVAIVVDYFIRAFLTSSSSPFSWAAQQLAEAISLPEKRIDKAPKIFAARVGFLFALATLVLYPISPVASIVVGCVLMGFALLESVADICVGCLVYTYVVFPFLGQQ